MQQQREAFMWWTAVLWFVYGVCSALFIMGLFKLGNSVANTPRTPAGQEVLGDYGAAPETPAESQELARLRLDSTKQSMTDSFGPAQAKKVS
jgi:hypothetical protein